ncbi:hypothetical protein BZG35_11895 [Brevundimonas sp. LM2]|uniref:ArnT family glycosyltransferase n=1 Tax=Brevundimonas sp. LM2 TaxID=1938605 RepID=UPI000983A087|nr:glycosyltransferase family 39 protein [Brevundimonas sp. LM2]AQR62266.1 hypothetical protein BZG35_11895 [Brevundimonas sp. LM2]
MATTGRFGLELTPRAVAAAIVGVLCVRLVFAATIPLTEDEAYYRLWSMRLQWGYFDHPPMIAWWIALGRGLLGDTALGARLLPVLANAAIAVLLIDTLRSLGAGDRPALRAGLWLNATLLIGTGAMLAVPDAPAALFWTLSLWAVSRAVAPGRTATPGRTAAWWVVAGLTAGLAVLSKYSALFLAPGILLWLCATAENRRPLLTPGPWLAAVLALAIVAPHILWNAEHGWVSVIKQFGRVEPKTFDPEYLGDLLAGQFALLNPIIAVLAGIAVFRGRLAVLKTPAAVLVLSSLPFLAYLVLHSLHDRVQAHWPVPVYPALVGLAALAAERLRPGSIWRRAVPVLGFGLCALALILAAVPALDAVSGKAMRPLRGWPAFAAAVQTRMVETPAGRPPAAWVGTASYGLAAQLAAEPGLTAPIVQLNDRARYDHLPPMAASDFARPGLVVDLPRRITAEALRTCFAEVEALPPIVRNATEPNPQARVDYAAFRVARPIRTVSGGCWRQRAPG